MFIYERKHIDENLEGIIPEELKNNDKMVDLVVNFFNAKAGISKEPEAVASQAISDATINNILSDIIIEDTARTIASAVGIKKVINFINNELHTVVEVCNIPKGNLEHNATKTMVCWDHFTEDTSIKAIFEPQTMRTSSSMTIQFTATNSLVTRMFKIDFMTKTIDSYMPDDNSPLVNKINLFMNKLGRELNFKLTTNVWLETPKFEGDPGEAATSPRPWNTPAESPESDNESLTACGNMGAEDYHDIKDRGHAIFSGRYNKLPNIEDLPVPTTFFPMNGVGDFDGDFGEE